jgi:hypothetical protein
VKTFSAEVASQYAARRINKRLAIRFDLPSGSYGFVTGTRGSIVHEGVLYVGSGGLIKVSLADEAIAGAADETTVELASHRIVNGQVQQLFDPHVLDTIEHEIWYLQPALIFRFDFDSNRRLIDVERIDVRQIWDIQHLRSSSGGRRVRAILKSPGALAKVVEAKRNGPDLQKIIDAADTGYRDILSTMSEPIYWGRKPPKTIKTKKREK